jgi:hypothetical protein
LEVIQTLALLELVQVLEQVVMLMEAKVVMLLALLE